MNDTRKPRLRWYQYSLRSLCLVMLLACIGMSWVGVKMQRARRQREAVEAIKKLGGEVTWRSLLLLRRVDGDYFLADVDYVNFAGQNKGFRNRCFGTPCKFTLRRRGWPASSRGRRRHDGAAQRSTAFRPTHPRSRSDRGRKRDRSDIEKVAGAASQCPRRATLRHAGMAATRCKTSWSGIRLSSDRPPGSRESHAGGRVTMWEFMLRILPISDLSRFRLLRL